MLLNFKYEVHMGCVITYLLGELFFTWLLAGPFIVVVFFRCWAAIAIFHLCTFRVLPSCFSLLMPTVWCALVA